MAQQQQPQYQMHQMPERPFSPTQSSVSPGAPQNFSLPPNKRQRLSPDPRSQQGSPYIQSPYGMSPGATGPSTATASPQFHATSLPPIATTSAAITTTITAPPSTTTPRNFSHISVPPNPYTTPYTNGNVTPTINLPGNSMHSQFTSNNSPNIHHNPNSFAYQGPTQNLHGSQPGLQPTNHQFPINYNMPQQTTGIMGPPSKPAERDNVNDDQTDVLANAGVDLRAEESYAMSFYTGSFNSQPGFSQPSTTSGGHGFNQFEPGESTSFYGAGPANQPGQSTEKENQDRMQKKAADKAWADAAHNLARSREHELHKPHVNVSVLWQKMDKIARDNGLSLNTDPGGKMPTLKLASEFRGEVTMRTAVGPFGAITATDGGFLPGDTALADQLALVSLATNLRVRILLEEAVAIARGRFAGADGVVPPEWADAAAQAHSSAGTVVIDEVPRSGWESAVSPHTVPMKGSILNADGVRTSISDSVKSGNGGISYKGELTKSLRELAAADRELEEKRLQRRQNRSADSVSRSGSAVPGTPINSAAPEPTGKPLTKKEREKHDKGKVNAVDNHMQANNTMNTFLGGGKKKKYSWMTGGPAAASGGVSTPGRINTSTLPGTPGSGPLEKVRLTAEGLTKIGSIREAKYPLVELRDWVMALENDGKQLKSLQQAYTIYDKK